MKTNKSSTLQPVTQTVGNGKPGCTVDDLGCGQLQKQDKMSQGNGRLRTNIGKSEHEQTWWRTET